MGSVGVAGFGSVRSARSFWRGFCCDRVVADRGAKFKRDRYVVVHPSTARRRGWVVV